MILVQDVCSVCLSENMLVALLTSLLTHHISELKKSRGSASLSPELFNISVDVCFVTGEHPKVAKRNGKNRP